MKIKDKLEFIKQTYKYEFCGMLFSIYNNDLIRIYDRVDGICLYSGALLIDDEIPEELLNSEYKKEELIRMPDTHKFAICFYLEAPEKIEKPISLRANYI